VRVADELGRTFEVRFDINTLDDHRTANPEQFTQEELHTDLIFTYKCADDLETMGESNYHAVYLRGYDKEKNELIGHNCFGQEYKPEVRVEFAEYREIKFIRIQVTKLGRLDDPRDTKWHFFNLAHIDNWQKTISHQNGIYVGELDESGMKPHGYGEWKCEGIKASYFGHWLNGKRDGWGYNIYSTGKTFTGFFKED
jgi:hypothetical protein